MKKLIILSATLIAICLNASAKPKKIVPEAPIPDFIVKAQKVFVTNGGGNPLDSTSSTPK